VGAKERSYPPLGSCGGDHNGRTIGIDDLASTERGGLNRGRNEKNKGEEEPERRAKGEHVGR